MKRQEESKRQDDTRRKTAALLHTRMLQQTIKPSLRKMWREALVEAGTLYLHACSQPLNLDSAREARPAWRAGREGGGGGEGDGEGEAEGGGAQRVRGGMGRLSVLPEEVWEVMGKWLTDGELLRLKGVGTCFYELVEAFGFLSVGCAATCVTIRYYQLLSVGFLSVGCAATCVTIRYYQLLSVGLLSVGCAATCVTISDGTEPLLFASCYSALKSSRGSRSRPGLCAWGSHSLTLSLPPSLLSLSLSSLALSLFSLSLSLSLGQPESPAALRVGQFASVARVLESSSRTRPENHLRRASRPGAFAGLTGSDLTRKRPGNLTLSGLTGSDLTGKRPGNLALQTPNPRFQ
jgi:hypothetical protein